MLRQHTPFIALPAKGKPQKQEVQLATIQQKNCGKHNSKAETAFTHNTGHQTSGLKPSGVQGRWQDPSAHEHQSHWKKTQAGRVAPAASRRPLTSLKGSTEDQASCKEKTLHKARATLHQARAASEASRSTHKETRRGRWRAPAVDVAGQALVVRGVEVSTVPVPTREYLFHS